MKLFGFFKRGKKQTEEIPKDKYWSLTTREVEIFDPTWERITMAINQAQPNQSIFASLAHFHSELAIEVIQAMGDNDLYRVEALPPKSSGKDKKIYVKDGVSYDETVRFFEDYFKDGIIEGYRSWPIEEMS